MRRDHAPYGSICAAGDEPSYRAYRRLSEVGLAGDRCLNAFNVVDLARSRRQTCRGHQEERSKRGGVVGDVGDTALGNAYTTIRHAVVSAVDDTVNRALDNGCGAGDRVRQEQQGPDTHGRGSRSSGLSRIVP